MKGIKILNALLMTAWVYGTLGWIYIAGAALVHPQTLSLQLTHLTPWIREDTFGILCFGASIIAFFFWNLIRD